jgi:hypothetical protein
MGVDVSRICGLRPCFVALLRGPTFVWAVRFCVSLSVGLAFDARFGVSP